MVIFGDEMSMISENTNPYISNHANSMWQLKDKK
jgi:hypothetical protein